MNKTIYKQLDSRWASKPYPTKSSSFGGNGCGCVACTHIVIEQEKYKKYTPEKLRPWMVKQGFAVPGKGTLWDGIPKTLQHYGYKKVVHIDRDDPMSKAWKELNKKNRIGIILFHDGEAPNGVVWTASGHYVAFTNYKVKNNKHYFYTKDSGGRNNDGWHIYENSMRGLISQIWIVERIVTKDVKKPTKTKVVKKAKKTKAQLIAEKAIALSYPPGTAKSKYAYKGGSPLPAYKKAGVKVYGSKKNLSNCHVFVGTVLKECGYPKMTTTWSAIFKYLRKYMKEIKVNYKESQLKPGDIRIWQNDKNAYHIWIITGRKKKAEGAHNKFYPRQAKNNATKKHKKDWLFRAK